MSEAEKRSRALQVAAKSLTLVAEFKEDPEIQAALQEEPLLAAVCAKAEAATAVLQSALDADADTPLSVQDLNLLMVWDEALILPTSVSMVMVTDYMWTRVLPAYDLLQQRAVAMGMSHEEILAFMPVTARLLCSAVPGFKAFVWLPAKLRYALELIKVEQAFLQEQPLLARALDNPVIGAADWEGFDAPSTDAGMSGLASGASVGRKISMQNGSAIYLLAADEAADSIEREVRGGTEPWVVIPFDPFCQRSTELPFDGDALLDVHLLTADAAAARSLEARGRVKQGEVVKATSRPCGVLVFC